MTLSCFKAYDIRGKVPGDIDETLAYQIGVALVQELQVKHVVVGRDMRLESPSLALALQQGITDSGADVFDIGICGTEEVYFATQHYQAGAGVMITASHNPKGYNGMKLVREGARPISGDSGLFALRDRIVSKEDTIFAPQRGQCLAYPDKSAYISHLLSYVKADTLRPLKILANPGNGMAGPVLKALEPYLPFEWVYLFDKPDGHFPNGVPNPLLPDNRALTAKAIVTHGCDLGLAWDGDFDRCFFFDAAGRFIEGYYLVGMLAEFMLHQHPNEAIIHDPRLTWNTIKQVQQAGGRPIVSKTGHAFIKERMRIENAVYGGEMSAHHYFRDFAYCDSGMIPWLLVTSLMTLSGKSLAELVNERIAAFPCSGEINYTVDNAPAILERVERHYASLQPRIDRTDGLSIELDEVRFNLRMSNTEPLLRLNVESRDDASLVQKTVCDIEHFIYDKDAKALHVSRLGSADYVQLSKLFFSINQDEDQIHFHPHPFNDELCEKITQYDGQDLYVGLFQQDTLVGYGLLRGWDEGFSIPSLGIYLSPDARGKGLSKLFMSKLHELARQAGADVVRLKVYKDNLAALGLYKKLGYVFESEENHQLVGFFSLNGDDNKSVDLN